MHVVSGKWAGRWTEVSRRLVGEVKGKEQARDYEVGWGGCGNELSLLSEARFGVWMKPGQCCLAHVKQQAGDFEMVQPYHPILSDSSEPSFHHSAPRRKYLCSSHVAFAPRSKALE